MKATKWQVRADGEHLFKHLVRAMKESGCLAADDDVTTTGGVLQSAIYVIDRMKDELDAARARCRLPVRR